MKKKLALIAAALVLAVSAVSLTACGGEPTTPDNGTGVVVTDKAAVADSADALNQVWNTYAEDEKFAAMGGDYTTPVDNAAGLMNLADKEAVIGMLQLPAEFASLDKVDSAASLLHMMNANTFTGAAYKMKNAADADAFIDELKAHYPTVQWMCGTPETLVLVKINGGDYVVAAFGNADLISTFSTKMQTVYGNNAAVAATVALV